MDIVEHVAGVALRPDEATDNGWGISTGHDGLCWPVIALGVDGMDVGLGHWTAIPMGVYDFVHVADSVLCRVRFLGGKTVSEFSGWVVEGGAGKVSWRGDRGAERPADLADEDVDFGVVEETELECKVFADERAPG
jgi:hypothetical protein